MTPKIFVAGPLRGNRAVNTKEAARVGLELVRKGWRVYIPHTMFAGFELYDIPEETFMELVRQEIAECHAMILFGDWQRSEGSMLERKEAQVHGLPVFADINVVPNAVDFVFSTAQLVGEIIRERNKLGVAKYEQPLNPWNGRNSKMDLLEESADMLMYALNVSREDYIDPLKP
jgi:hypothetical protein